MPYMEILVHTLWTDNTIHSRRG